MAAFNSVALLQVGLSLILNSVNKALRVSSKTQENKFYRIHELLGFRKTVASLVAKNESLTGHNATPTAHSSSEVARL